MQSLLDRMQSIGAIQSGERGAEQQKEREIERIRTLIRRLESMDVEEAEEELDAELEKAAVMCVGGGVLCGCCSRVFDCFVQGAVRQDGPLRHGFRLELRAGRRKWEALRF
jgi:hypothetical protein